MPPGEKERQGRGGRRGLCTQKQTSGRVQDTQWEDATGCESKSVGVRRWSSEEVEGGEPQEGRLEQVQKGCEGVAC